MLAWYIFIIGVSFSSATFCILSFCCVSVSLASIGHVDSHIGAAFSASLQQSGILRKLGVSTEIKLVAVGQCLLHTGTVDVHL
jgi:hypothetical protein